MATYIRQTSVRRFGTHIAVVEDHLDVRHDSYTEGEEGRVWVPSYTLDAASAPCCASCGEPVVGLG